MSATKATITSEALIGLLSLLIDTAILVVLLVRG
jgi:hypothetical protein